MIGAGFALDAIRRARQFERDMRSRAPRVRVRHRDDRPVQEREEFACFYLCGSCGLLREPGASDPTRADPEQPDPILARDCGHCGARAWIDLRNQTSALAVRDIEESLRQEPPAWVRGRIKMASGGIGAVAGGAAALALAALFAPAAGALAVVAAASGGVTALASNSLLAKPLSRLLMSRSPIGPARWFRPLPIPDQGSEVIETIRGMVESDETPLVAPLSGRSCLAYEVGVIFDADGDAYPPVWVLREVRSRALRVDGRTFEAGAVDLELEMVDVGEQALKLPGSDLRTFLRQRGLFISDGQFDLFEAVLLPGQAIELRKHSPQDSPWVAHLAT
jgi:hypothetical protein